MYIFIYICYIFIYIYFNLENCLNNVNKQKTLYMEEIAKMKTKQDRELVIINNEVERLKTEVSLT